MFFFSLYYQNIFSKEYSNVDYSVTFLLSILEHVHIHDAYMWKIKQTILVVGVLIWNYGVGMTQGYKLAQSLSHRLIKSVLHNVLLEHTLCLSLFCPPCPAYTQGYLGLTYETRRAFMGLWGWVIDGCFSLDFSVRVRGSVTQSSFCTLHCMHLLTADM